MVAFFLSRVKINVDRKKKQCQKMIGQKKNSVSIPSLVTKLSTTPLSVVTITTESKCQHESSLPHPRKEMCQWSDPVRAKLARDLVRADRPVLL